MKTAIRIKNDIFRKTFIGGRVILTESVSDSPHRERIINAVKSFNKFTIGNDPHTEHDFGKIELEGQIFFWKIDYYDSKYEFFEEDGRRVLTIMHASDY